MAKAKKKKKPTRKPPKLRPLTVQQQRFVEYILKGETQSYAYMKAGYKSIGNAAEVSACQLLRNPKIKAAINKVREKANRAAEITQTRILEEESRLALYDPKELMDGNGKIIPLHKLPENIRRAIHGVEITQDALGTLKYKYKFAEKGKALERLEKIEGMFKAEKLDLTFNGSIEVIDSYAAKDKDPA